MSTLRDHATAFVVATIVSLVADAVMRLAFDAVRVTGGGGTPWWISANVIERGRWVVFAVVLWWVAPWFGTADGAGPTGAANTGEGADDRMDAWRRVGAAVLVVPLLWILATWLVSAARFSMLGSWETEGRVFLSPGYYRGLLLDYAPWLLGGATVLGIRRHL